MIEPVPAHPFHWSRQPWGLALLSGHFSGCAVHLFTTRDVDLRGPLARDGWREVAASVGVDAARLVRLEQVHGTASVAVRAGDGYRVADDEGNGPRADIVMTDDPTVAVSVQVADCVPMLLADRRTGAVAAVHAGWRGTAARAALEALAAMRANFGTRARDLIAAIGPSIGPCCYQVGSDVLDAFLRAGSSDAEVGRWFGRTPKGDGLTLDVARANIDQLRSGGIPPNSIDACGFCTACHPALFHSYRRDGAGTGRLAAVIRPIK